MDQLLLKSLLPKNFIWLLKVFQLVLRSKTTTLQGCFPVLERKLMFSCGKGSLRILKKKLIH